MKAVYFAATALVGVMMFWVGFQLRPVLDPWEQQEVAAVPGDESVEVRQTEQSAAELAAQGYLPPEELTVRIDDGEVQWFDGVIWHTVAPVEELAKEDKFYATQEGIRELEEQLKQQREDRRAEQESAVERGETLLVGQKAEPKPTEKPKSDKAVVTTPVTAPVFVPELTAPSENNGGGNTGGGDSGNPGGSNPGGGNSGNTGGGNTGGGNSGNSGNTGGGNPGGGNSGNSGNTGGGNPGGGNSGNTGGGNPGGGNSGNTGGGNPGGEDSGNSGNTGGGNPGGGDGGNSGNTGGDNPGGGDGGNTGGDNAGGDSGNSGADTGDGENMEWSDDYL